jgi:hypothetical protein
MTSPSPECTTGILEKRRVWPNGTFLELAEAQTGLDRTRSKVTGGGWFAIRRHADIMAAYKIIVLF